MKYTPYAIALCLFFPTSLMAGNNCTSGMTDTQLYHNPYGGCTCLDGVPKSYVMGTADFSEDGNLGGCKPAISSTYHHPNLPIEVGARNGRTGNQRTLRVWLDGSDPFGDGRYMPQEVDLSQWTDKSTFNNHFATSIGSPRYIPNALNGRSVIHFDGTNDSLQSLTSATTILDHSSPYSQNGLTIFIVATDRTTTTAQYQSAILSSEVTTSTHRLLLQISCTTPDTAVANPLFAYGDTDSAANVAQAIIDNEEGGEVVTGNLRNFPTTWTATYDINTDVTPNKYRISIASESELVAGTSDKSEDFPPMTNTYPMTGNMNLGFLVPNGSAEYCYSKDPVIAGYSGGSNRFWRGDIAEVLIYSEALDDGQQDLIRAYLRDKWHVW